MANIPISIPVGPSNILLINEFSTFAERQEVASCLLNAVAAMALDEPARERTSVGEFGFGLCCLTRIAQALLDSMDLTEADTVRGAT